VSTSSIEKVNGTQLPETSHAESWARAGIADAEAEAIRARTAAEIEERRIKAQAEADAIRATAAAEAEKLRLANERAALRFEREKAEQLAKIAEANRVREAEERAADEERKAAEAAVQEQEAAEEAVETATGRWRKTAKGFYALCAAVALPVQMAAFYKEDAKYLIIAPVFIELIALVALIGAAAAVTAGRPHWHYRLVAWGGALAAATINIVHGLDAFDEATAFGTALASIAGPGMWDLHEHGRIARRDGTPTWRERRAAKKTEKRNAAQKAAEEARIAAEQEASRKAAKALAEKLANDRAEHFPKVWAHAVRLAAALGEATVTEAIWKQAHNDIEGTDPSESVDIIRGRNAAARRVVAARSEAPGEKPVKVTNTQRSTQVMGASARPRTKPVPPRRKAGDTPRFHPVARSLAAESKRRSMSSKTDENVAGG
jgi:VIT1/CCC1 family predicted Fe2+/Mn2+ transporter